MASRNSADFVRFAQELLGAPGAVEARAMFGGHGLYADGMIFALVVEDTLYLKTDDATRPAFAARGLSAFTYVSKQRGAVDTSYWSVPAEALEGAAAMREWRDLALAAARRSAAAKARSSGSAKRAARAPASRKR